MSPRPQRRKYLALCSDGADAQLVVLGITLRVLTAVIVHYMLLDDLAAILDRSRSVVEWAISAVNDRRLTLKALEMAVQRRCPEPGLLHHSNRGCIYTCEDWPQLLRRAFDPVMGHFGLRRSFPTWNGHVPAVI